MTFVSWADVSTSPVGLKDALGWSNPKYTSLENYFRVWMWGSRQPWLMTKCRHSSKDFLCIGKYNLIKTDVSVSAGFVREAA